jgi:hypothetical protein
MQLCQTARSTLASRLKRHSVIPAFQTRQYLTPPAIGSGIYDWEPQLRERAKRLKTWRHNSDQCAQFSRDCERLSKDCRIAIKILLHIR